ncbi:iron permease FTR1 [Suhomyces tanzawaensis NRRL Y-17324]|uniref:Iron permease FTR1 n=1 Tax=Suhomyces tanzawaensis NRRL Y-17324 TaxID=984487 RepID=A0A1E4SK58_9ASCO|nr:iron permease FTR1 [Suhomyces tanzawaensis NRRL Y-17324]ODV79891.1 iron permease FTR1 [Suhomyces tanzawaensis NRRL Y-17324]
MIEDYFSIQIFFIILRETLETAIIISVLLSFINQRSQTSAVQGPQQSQNFDRVQSKLKLQVWVGAILGLLICFVIGLVFIACFYFIGKDYWSYAERLWEGVFSLLSSMIITVMGIGLLRINKVMKVKWWIKLGDAYNETESGDKNAVTGLDDSDDLARDSLDSSTPLVGQGPSALAPKPKAKFTKRYFLAILPLITTLREGLEAVVFIGGIGMSQPLTSIPLSIAGGLLVGSIIGYILYQGGNKLSLQYFLIFLTCFLYIVSAGLMSRGVWFLELESYVRACGGLDVSETGSGPGSYDIAKSVWHVNCCNGLTDGWWMVFNAIFGWTNSATYGSVFSYIAYWLLVIIWLEVRLYEEREGVLPLVPIKWQLKRIAKKVKLYETRQKQQPQVAQELSSNHAASSEDLNEREAEAEVLLS